MKRTIMLLMAFIFILSLAGCGDKNEASKDTENADTEDFEITQSPLDVVQEITFSDDDEPQESDSEKLEKKINEFNITIRFGEEIEGIGPEEVRQYITTNGGSVTAVNEDAVREYVNTLSKKYDTFGISREFRKHDGNTTTVTGGDFGWWMDRVTTAKELTERIRNLEGGDFEPVYFGTGLGYKTAGSDIGTTYVEIDLDAQHLYVYKDSNMVEQSDFVSGCLMKGNGTPVGTYGITYKERDATLVGENYSSSVSFWMPFNGNIGMHDASWRSDFGGHLYYMNGSHGCINLPKSKAESIYGIVEKGEPVVVYGSMTKEKAIANLTEEEKLVAIQKGYIPMSDEMALLLLQQQQAAAGQNPEGEQPAPDPNAPEDSNQSAPDQNQEQNNSEPAPDPNAQ